MNIRDAIRERNFVYEKWHGLAERYSEINGEPLHVAQHYLSRTLGAPLYHSSSQIDNLLRASSASLPQTTIAREILPTNDGLWLFTEPWRTIPREYQRLPGDSILFPGEPDPLLAEVMVCGFAWVSYTDAICLSILSKYGNDPAFLPECHISWQFDSTLEEAEATAFAKDANAAIPSRQIMRLLLTSCLFVKQRILELARNRPDRAQRKWAAKIELPDSDCRIVQLRQKQYERKDGESEERDWSCHWLVKGHWRAQYHPSTGIHEPLWILPHLKGDFEKPFKPPTETAFAVTR